MRHRFAFVLAMLALRSATAGGAEPPIESLALVAGETHVLPATGVGRVALGDGELAEVRVLEDVGQILLIARQAGHTDLRVWAQGRGMRRYRLDIAPRDVLDVQREIAERIADIAGTSAQVRGGRVVITGSGLTEGQYKRIEALAAAYPGMVEVEASGGGVTLRSMVLLDVKVVEVDRNRTRDLGVNWDDAIDGPVFGYLSDWVTNDLYRGTVAPGAPAAGIVVPPLDAGRGNAFLGISTRLGSVIDLLVKNGDARLLAEPKLTCRSGGEAEFLAGGEIPLPITGDDGEVSVEFKDYGVILRMQPTIDAAGYIDTDVEVEVSAIDPSVTVQSIPGFLTRRTHTDMNLRQGQTLVISGLLSSRSSGDLEKVPGLGDLPILGELFRSRAFRSDETELVVFVTPHLIDPDTPVNHALMERARTLVDAARRVDDEQQAPATAPATEPGEQWPHE